MIRWLPHQVFVVVNSLKRRSFKSVSLFLQILFFFRQNPLNKRFFNVSNNNNNKTPPYPPSKRGEQKKSPSPRGKPEGQGEHLFSNNHLPPTTPAYSTTPHLSQKTHSPYPPQKQPKSPHLSPKETETPETNQKKNRTNVKKLK